MNLKIQHRTSDRYDQPVVLGVHRIMVRPRESRDLRLVSSDLLVTPVFDIKWAQDIFGNALAAARFRQMTDQLVIDAVAELDSTAWTGPCSTLPYRR